MFEEMFFGLRMNQCQKSFGREVISLVIEFLSRHLINKSSGDRLRVLSFVLHQQKHCLFYPDTKNNYTSTGDTKVESLIHLVRQNNMVCLRREDVFIIRIQKQQLRFSVNANSAPPRRTVMPGL